MKRLESETKKMCIYEQGKSINENDINARRKRQRIREIFQTNKKMKYE